MRRLSVYLASFVIAGCVNLEAPVDPTRYYVINGGGLGSSDQSAAVEVQVVELAPHLATPRMVVRVMPNEIRYSDVNRWGAPLAESIKNTLNGYLSSLSNSRVLATGRGDLVLRLYVHRFEGYAPDSAHLLITWVAVDGDGREVASRRSEHLVPGWDGIDYEALAALLESAVASMAEDVLNALE